MHLVNMVFVFVFVFVTQYPDNDVFVCHLITLSQDLIAYGDGARRKFLDTFWQACLILLNAHNHVPGRRADITLELGFHYKEKRTCTVPVERTQDRLEIALSLRSAGNKGIPSMDPLMIH
ncbi:hypothetical protein ACJX0J_039207, partial [Zea mays]